MTLAEAGIAYLCLLAVVVIIMICLGKISQRANRRAKDAFEQWKRSDKI